MNGAIFLGERKFRFTLWAPLAKKVQLKLLTKSPKLIDMVKVDDENFEISETAVLEDEDYAFVIDEKEVIADPASRWQPDGVLAYSRVYQTNKYKWKDKKWKGMPLQDHLFYEMHIGTFTDGGTFQSAIEKIDYLVDLGITAVELMPVSSFSGSRNWGYDGVFPYAPQQSYGGPDGLKAFVDACHRKGLSVFLDVVYNHIGPEGSVLQKVGTYFTDKYHTPWGSAMNYDGPYSDGVRSFVIDNAIYLIHEFHLDGLRLDAVHAIFDFGAKHVLLQLKEEVEKSISWPVHLIAESDLNDSRIVDDKKRGGYNLDGQWNDDFHHALHACLTGDKSAYFVDFGKISQLAKAISKGFVYDGQKSLFRKRCHGNSSEHLKGEKLVVFSQNHDQIANAMRGKRQSSYLTIEQQKLICMFLFISPNLPLLFMGQEWGAKTRFDFFTNFSDPKLSEAVSLGRKHEYRHHNLSDNFCDPEDIETYENSKLNWQELDNKQNKEILHFYKTLISLRKEIKSLSNCRKDLTEVKFSEEGRWLAVLRKDPDGGGAVFTANLSDKRQEVAIPWQLGKWQLKLCTTKDHKDPYAGCLFTCVLSFDKKTF